MKEHPVVLVAENEPVIALDLRDTVEEAGYIVEGPHERVDQAILAVQANRPDLAILDIELDDGMVYPLAERLAQEQIPFIFHSGRTPLPDTSDRFPGAPMLAKPCPPSEMLRGLEAALAHR
ncbi:response regulator [Erythrobacteraceae bacterium CFH 75059]|uniref:response regulator n=1 Tax=Qipengyuania thermophila TaxID=2509361 RepID=UPI00102255CA|nr:response regulator [Qipengyuania thermophila]TCD06378.1 response regulator [Erythrobacteraceae bacterium CFH 75059]